MNYMIIGLGSMGKRRLRLLAKADPNATIYGIDSNEERRKAVEEEYHIQTFASMDEISDAEAAFVSTSPLAHSGIITKLLEKNLHVFTEINLNAEGYEENMRLAKEKNKVLFLSSTMLYRKELCYIKEHIHKDNNTYTYHVGQYLPDWHPWENYKNFFVGNKESNGCRELLAIELPWIINTFGKITNMQIIKKKKSSLDLPYEDTYQLLLEHEHQNTGVITIDLVSRKAMRKLEIIHEDYQYFWSGQPDSLEAYNIQEKKMESISLYDSYEHNAAYSDNIIENAYMDEVLTYLECIKNHENTKYSFKEDAYTQKIIETIEEA